MKLRELLNEFAGLDAEGVAAKLRAEGIKGVRKSCTLCPVACWLFKHGLPVVSVEDGEVLAMLPDSTEKCRTPIGLDEFIGEFDRGGWPELEQAL